MAISDNKAKGRTQKTKGKGEEALVRGQGEDTEEERGKSKPKSVLVEDMIQTIGAKFQNEQMKATLGDFIRLLQLQEEIDEESPKEVRVTWVEPVEEESATET